MLCTMLKLSIISGPRFSFSACPVKVALRKKIACVLQQPLQRFFSRSTGDYAANFFFSVHHCYEIRDQIMACAALFRRFECVCATWLISFFFFPHSRSSQSSCGGQVPRLRHTLIITVCTSVHAGFGTSLFPPTP